MLSAASISLSGMGAAQTALSVSANNIANASTPGFRRQQATDITQAGGGVTTSVGEASDIGPSLNTDVVHQLQAKDDFAANVSAFKASDKMTGALLSVMA